VNFLELQSANTFDSNLFPGGEIAQNGVLCLAMTWALYGSVSNEPNLAAAALLFSFHAQMMWMNDPRSREHFCSQLILAKIAPRRRSGCCHRSGYEAFWRLGWQLQDLSHFVRMMATFLPKFSLP